MSHDSDQDEDEEGYEIRWVPCESSLYSMEQKTFILDAYRSAREKKKSVRQAVLAVQDAFREKFPFPYERYPGRDMILNLEKKMKLYGNLENRKAPPRRTVRTSANVRKVEQALKKNPALTIKQLAAKLNVCTSSCCKLIQDARAKKQAAETTTGKRDKLKRGAKKN